MDKYIIAPPAGSTNNAIGANDRKWAKGYFEELPDWQDYLAEATGYGVVRGCNPSITGLVVSVGNGLVHMYTGKRKEFTAATVTLDAADSTNPRIDLVYLGQDGTLQKSTGTAAESPLPPAVPDNAIAVCTVTVEAAASTGTILDCRGIKYRQPNTTYAEKAIAFCVGLPTGWYLEVATAGETSNAGIDLPSPVVENLTINDGTVVWKIRRLGAIGTIASPSYYQREQLPTPAQASITINPTWLNIGGVGYKLTQALTINLNSADSWDASTYATAANRKGCDVYIYATATADSITPGFILSLNSTVPTGYTADNSRKIGGFHCLCTDVGSITGHPLTGYVAGDILPQSVWDLSFRAVSENAGMVYVPGIGKWVDIYLPSWQNGGMASVNGGTIVDGSSTPAINGDLAVEYFGLVGKELISRDEFLVAMAGSNQGTNIYGGVDPVTTGGHKDTANRRMISNYGIEDGCGALWQWGRDQYENYPGSTWTNTNYYLDGYAWQQIPVFNSNIESTIKGRCFGLWRRVLLGASWYDGASCGSRAAGCEHFSADCVDALSARGVSSLRGVA